MTIRVVLVDDQEMVRSGLAMLVDSQDDLTVAGTAGTGDEAIELVAKVSCDVVLMDVRMPGTDGVEATRRIVARPGAPRVVVLTTFDLDEYAYAALRAGASGFLLKDAPPEDLLRAIRVVHAGDSVVAPSTTRRLIAHVLPKVAPDPEVARRIDGLSAREREVLLELARGRSNVEIANALFVSEATVKTHVGKVLTKLRLRDRVQAVVFAYEHGLVSGG
jgi:DNA-binding NarL/FixJ family response regulator